MIKGIRFEKGINENKRYIQSILLSNIGTEFTPSNLTITVSKGLSSQEEITWHVS